MTAREFLAGWVLTFGTGPVTWPRRKSNAWYTQACKQQVAVNSSCVAAYFDASGGDTYQINEAGLNYLKGDDDDPRADTPAG